jgi:hypothetical protein
VTRSGNRITSNEVAVSSFANVPLIPVEFETSVAYGWWFEGYFLCLFIDHIYDFFDELFQIGDEMTVSGD